MNDTGILGVRAWRLRKGISLGSIAATTKLSVRQLEAIESGDFSRLPGGIYNTSYIRQYARAIDFDESDLLAFYQNCCSPVAPAARPEPEPSRGPRLLFQH
ncbi:MAG TPA: helix-turn-helix transcriptional regulator [Bryobacteraceae bacterium]|jgi:cytoskeletal protein RodZ|nr:helix-turn-helix transcriptional regulator [Bryobacteraceae bacterium]